MKPTLVTNNEIKKPRKSFISKDWLKEEKIGKIGYIFNPKNSNVKFND